jgi:hypothetical protein
MKKLQILAHGGDSKWFFRAGFWFLNGFLRTHILSVTPVVPNTGVRFSGFRCQVSDARTGYTRRSRLIYLYFGKSESNSLQNYQPDLSGPKRRMRGFEKCGLVLD